MGILIHLVGREHLVPPPGSAIWQQLGRLKTSMPYEPAISLTGTLPISLKHVCQEIWKDAHCNTV